MRYAIRSVFLIAAAVATASCDSVLEPRDHTYDGPPTVEFAPVLPSGTYALPVAIQEDSNADHEANVRLNYIGAPPAGNVTGTFAVAEESSAIEGTHFTLSGDKSYTVPAGENETEISLAIHGAALENGQVVTIVLVLEESSDFEVSENYDRFTIEVSKGGG